jgi:NAD+ kinase
MTQNIENPDIVIILGGDGSIAEAVRKYINIDTLFVGFNMGNVGFLASVRDKESFASSMHRILAGDYIISERMIVEAKVYRAEKQINSAIGINEAAIQNITGVVDLDIDVNGTYIQHIRGGGMLVSTSSGSTAYNLSSDGPIVVPSIKCMIINELLDHNTPTPSLIVDEHDTVSIHVKNFRERHELLSAKTHEYIDTGLFLDGVLIETLQVGDIIKVSKYKKYIRIVELERGYFLESIREKFNFK